tara:strand:+ start:686 stop:958 length:273 start_codon:yes stop_codon:yes gene_type:complete
MSKYALQVREDFDPDQSFDDAMEIMSDFIDDNEHDGEMTIVSLARALGALTMLTTEPHRRDMAFATVIQQASKTFSNFLEAEDQGLADES